ncbi:hypothetical protein QFC22_002321 [Naganishia vaughanmartiniae]|uniref:Uncharacterized protein n=1 Tax=Naganishia vaughanmartiniae TaxID=1424756 RepID=A0ACC2XDI2_9TREE|nr:hypothetical protein QFC22_002321 [Naganishia vaughanmartiniae]
MQSVTSPDQLSFDDFLNFKTPTTASGNDSSEFAQSSVALFFGVHTNNLLFSVDSLSFSLIPPTPHDMRGHSFGSPLQYAPSVGSGLPFDMHSPPPFGGIMSPKTDQPSHTLRPVSGFRSVNAGGHRRSASISSQGHRHEPYKHSSRQSSISSLSAAALGSDGNSSDWQWESGVDEGKLSTDIEALSSSPLNSGLSICPADLQMINLNAMRNQNLFASFAPETPLSKSQARDNQGDSDSQSDQDSVVGTSRVPHARHNAPKLQAVPLSKIKREVSPSSIRSEKSGASRRTRAAKPAPSYREESEVPDSPILVTAITSSGKKSHARKADTVTKTQFQEQARLEKEQHMRDYPNYKYQPVYRRSQVVRRQIKADPVEEKKCALVANLLLDGKNGDELTKETKRAVERSNKQRAKVARSLAEASDSQSVYGSGHFLALTDGEQASDDEYTNASASTPVTHHAEESCGTPSTARAAPSVVSDLRHQLATHDFMQSTSVARMSHQRQAPQHQYAGPSHTTGNAQMGATSYMYTGNGNMMFDPQDIFTLNHGHGMQHVSSQQQMQPTMAPPSHYVLAMHNNAAELQFVQRNDMQQNNNQFDMSMQQSQHSNQGQAQGQGQSQGQPNNAMFPSNQQHQQLQTQPALQPLPQQQDAMLWPPMSDEDLLGYADAFNMLNDFNGQPWPNMM